MKNKRLSQQMNFIIEIDKLKNIFRQTYLMNGKRNENDAEHSWHIALMAILLVEYLNEMELDILKVIKMLLIHDLVEIDAGDTYVYDKERNKDKREREQSAAYRIFNFLPADQAREFHKLWEEFEDQNSSESTFALALDILQPLLSNYITKGKSWKYHNVKKEQVIKRCENIKYGSSILWDYAKELIEDSIKRGYLSK